MGLLDFFSSSSSSPSPSPSPPPSALQPTSSPSSSTASIPPPSTSPKHITPQNPTGIKPCCACPETKIPRDDCFLRYGHEGLEAGKEHEGEGWRCRELVEEHKRCMKRLGFTI